MSRRKPLVRWCLPEYEGKGRNDFSQFGEDGLIEYALAAAGETNRWCFEIGAADGLYYSNTKRLIDLGWSAVLIEKNPNHWPALGSVASDKVSAVLAECSPSGLSDMLELHGCPEDCDLGVIDVDGQDYWFLRYLRHRPRVLMVEVSVADSPIPEEGGSGQAGVTAITELAVSFGYRPVARTHCNAIFTRMETG